MRLLGLFCLIVIIGFFIKELGSKYPLVLLLIVLLLVIVTVQTCEEDKKKEQEQKELNERLLQKRYFPD